jgi:GNAT superfamily N-acetyltransferase
MNSAFVMSVVNCAATSKSTILQARRNTAVTHSIPSDRVSLRAMCATDLPAALALSQRLSWPHRLEDWQMMFRLGTGLVLEDRGQLIGTALCCVQGGFSSVGLVIVAREYQGRGLGRRLMQAALDLSAGTVATLTATPEGAPLYEKLGFATCGRLVQHQGLCPGGCGLPQNAGIRALGGDERMAAVALANAGSGLARDAVLQDLLAESQRAHVMEACGERVGLALLRPFGRGLAIGPVIARNPGQARALIQSLLGQVSGCFVRIDVTAASGLSPWLDSIGLPRVDEPVQMARGPGPTGRAGFTQYAVVSQALG